MLGVLLSWLSVAFATECEPLVAGEEKSLYCVETLSDRHVSVYVLLAHPTQVRSMLDKGETPLYLAMDLGSPGPTFVSARVLQAGTWTCIPSYAILFDHASFQLGDNAMAIGARLPLGKKGANANFLCLGAATTSP